MVSKITFEKFFDRIQELIGINKKKNKNVKIEEKQKTSKQKSKKVKSNEKKRK